MEMKEYIIISINDNKGGSDGHVIIVKANPVKEYPGFAHLSKLFGKKYYTYAMNETNETEIYVFPYSDERMKFLMYSAKLAEQEEDFWHPKMNEFYDACLMMDRNEIKKIKKHISFKRQKKGQTSGIKEIVDTFHYSNSLSGIFKGNKKNTEVKNVSLGEGSIYSGKALLMGNLCVPNGYGVKLFKSEGNKKIGSFYCGGSIGKIAWISYPNKYLYIGCVCDEKPNGWGFKLAKGQFTFGYFKGGRLYKDMSPFATDIFYSIRSKKIDIGNVGGEICRLSFGLIPSEHRPFEGFQFLENGTVYIGESFNANEYELTGRYIRIEIDGKATCGHFKDGKLVKPMSQEEYFNMYTSKSTGQEKIDLTTDYLSSPDCNMYFIVGMESKFNLDMGPILSINALPFDTLEMPKGGNLNFDIKQMEYFYLHAEESIARIIQEKSQMQRLWKVNLDDFNTHFDYVTDISSKQVIQKNFHIHNALIGLNYSNIIDFDSVNVMTRIEELKNDTTNDLGDEECLLF